MCIHTFCYTLDCGALNILYNIVMYTRNLVDFQCQRRAEHSGPIAHKCTVVSKHSTLNYRHFIKFFARHWGANACDQVDGEVWPIGWFWLTVAGWTSAKRMKIARFGRFITSCLCRWLRFGSLTKPNIVNEWLRSSSPTTVKRCQRMREVIKFEQCNPKDFIYLVSGWLER